MTQVEKGDRFYDERNGRYITVIEFGCDPNVALCTVEDITNEYETMKQDRQLFKKNELLKFIRQ